MVFFPQAKAKKRNVGDVRQSQLITSYGVGSIIDFVEDTVIIAGVDDWEDLEELRLYNENLQALTGVDYFLQPKVDTSTQSFGHKSQDIPAYVFPEKLYCTNCHKIIDVKELENQKKVHDCFFCRTKKPLVAARFIVACENGHMEDFPYAWWVHKGGECPAGKESPRIEMFNMDGRSGVDSLMVKCVDCEAQGIQTIRPMQGAFRPNALAGEDGYPCKGYFPHLKDPEHFASKGCEEILKIRLRTSSGVYFPVSKSALTIPPWSREAVKVILAHMDILKPLDAAMRKIIVQQVILPKAPKTITEDDLLSALKIVFKPNKDKGLRKEKDVYEDEYLALAKGNGEDDEFSSFKVPVPQKYASHIDQIVVVDRLTEIQALCGYTRLKPYSGADSQDHKLAPLSMYKKNWLPAVKMKGEGIFIQLNQEKIEDWTKKVGNRYGNMIEKCQESYLESQKLSPLYIMLHTLSHLLMREISYHCGYSVASLKEKIYSTFNDREDDKLDMQGILIYLATSDSEGSLGGLISIAEDTNKLEQIISDALKKAEWCSGDPLCINSLEQGLLSLNYAACHDCTLLPETSCEFRNVLLDRAAVVGTNEDREIGFMAFKEADEG